MAIHQVYDLTVIIQKHTRVPDNWIDSEAKALVSKYHANGLDITVQTPKHRQHHVILVGGRSFVVKQEELAPALKALGV